MIDYNDIEYSSDTSDSLYILNKLSKKEQEQFCLDGYIGLNDNGIVYQRAVKYKNKPYSFIRICVYPGVEYKGLGYISVASIKEARGKGFAASLVQDAINYIRSRTMISPINILCWEVEKTNIASIHLATKLGFKQNYEVDNVWGYIMKLKPSKTLSGTETPKALLDYMKKNIHYAEFTKLKSPEEVIDTKKGSCHDQMMLELHELRQMGMKPNSMFFMEYNPQNNQGGETHSFVYYKQNNKIFWFEHACGDYVGIHQYDDLKSIKDDIIRKHKSGRLGNCNKFPKIEFSSVGKHEPGESLQAFVDKCLK